MHSKDIVVNCPHCLADTEVSRLDRMTECPFCGKQFNIEDGKKAREMVLSKKSALSENLSSETSGTTATSSPTPNKAKYCTECGRKLAFDARYCDWCGVKI